MNAERGSPSTPWSVWRNGKRKKHLLHQALLLLIVLRLIHNIHQQFINPVGVKSLLFSFPLPYILDLICFIPFLRYGEVGDLVIFTKDLGKKLKGFTRRMINS